MLGAPGSGLESMKSFGSLEPWHASSELAFWESELRRDLRQIDTTVSVHGWFWKLGASFEGI